MGETWEDSGRITPEQVKALMSAMGFDTNQTKFAKVLNVTPSYINHVLSGRKDVRNGPLQVLLRWLFAEYGIDGGRAPVPSIRVRRTT